MQCTFCDIVARRAPATIRYQDDDVLVFDNVLTWLPVMLLVIPKAHMTQVDLWRSPLAGKLTELGIRFGEEHCPDGFRLLANIGPDALQSQAHGHLHIIGGKRLGLYL